jgi:hypothetical protein
MASKKIEVDKTMSKVAYSSQAGPPNMRQRYDNDKRDLRMFLSKGAPVPYGNRNNMRRQPYQPSKKFQSKRYFQRERRTQSYIQRILSEKFACYTSPSLGLDPTSYNQPPACRTRHRLLNWSLVTQDPWVLETVSGYKLELATKPVQRLAPKVLEVSSSQVKVDITKFLEKVVFKVPLPRLVPQQGFHGSQEGWILQGGGDP